MNRTEELKIIDTLLENIQAMHPASPPAEAEKAASDGPGWFSLQSMADLPDITSKPASLYIEESRFEAEADRIFRTVPMAAAFSAELAPGTYIRRTILGQDFLIARAADGGVQVMHNICRHRGARLCAKPQGKGKIVCPYHAWVYSLSGQRIGAPGAEGFAQNDVRLHTIPTVEHHGIIWVRLNGESLNELQVDRFLGPDMTATLIQMELGQHRLLDSTARNEAVNWKLAVEGGLENYHFGPTHAGTVGPQFWEQAGGLVRLGEHLRFVTPRRSIHRLQSAPPAKRHLRPHAFITFLIMPNLNIFLERRHVAIHLVMPQSARSMTMHNISLLPPQARTTGKAGQYFQAAHDHTNAVLEEDYTIHRSQMASMLQKPDIELSFGQQEAGIKVLHHWLDRRLA